MKHSRPSKVIVVQPVVPSYRKSFFDGVSNMLGERFSVYASEQDMGVLTEQRQSEFWKRSLGPLRGIGMGIEWQSGALSIPLERDDIVVISGAPRCLSNIFLLVKARLAGARTIWWGQLWSSTTQWHRFIIRLLLMRLAHSVLFYTDQEVAIYRTRFGRRDARPIGALNNGIDISPIKKNRRSYVAAERESDIVFIGRVTEKANLALLLDAMTKKYLSHAVLHVVGDGPDRINLQAWAEKNGLKARVVWHGATVDEARIAEIANRSSLFCYPGGVGLSIVHAMAYGLPAVVHDCNSRHMPEIAAFENGVTGLKFKINDAISLSQTLGALLANPLLREEMSHRAIDRASNLYNTEKMVERFEQMLRHLEN